MAVALLFALTQPPSDVLALAAVAKDGVSGGHGQGSLAGDVALSAGRWPAWLLFLALALLVVSLTSVSACYLPDVALALS